MGKQEELARERNENDPLRETEREREWEMAGKLGSELSGSAGGEAPATTEATATEGLAALWGLGVKVWEKDSPDPRS